MKEITQLEIDAVKKELAAKRKEFDSLGLSSLEEKLKWIESFFNRYVSELEKRYLSEKELEEWVFLPDELRIQFYLYFPEHGLTMANYSQKLAYELAKKRQKERQFVNRAFFSH